ncbi:MmpS family transport accessory protein [[Mycobacterium] kokjensenii]|uniref:MmpS family transport accessory protein n=1 Tax=[Mycobacterium] kokjensenii TaxID=3064287 RepID=A0ABM9LF99_9MYCO|nr:MmpS family transport accessory protein [Mycolicibacter sp. MU0083]CAJ1498100.1 MmpS family transport accessory protein [Mycolicibacter sp. MU0083]
MTVHPSPVRMPRRAMSLLFGALAASAVVAGVPSAGATPDHTKVPVRYDLTGTGVASYVTYQGQNGQAHATNVALPWSIQLTGSMTNATSPASYSLSAQTAGPGSLTCTVTVNGKVVAQNTASGAPARVLCETHGPKFADES